MPQASFESRQDALARRFAVPDRLLAHRGTGLLATFFDADADALRPDRTRLWLLQETIVPQVLRLAHRSQTQHRIRRIRGDEQEEVDLVPDDGLPGPVPVRFSACWR